MDPRLAAHYHKLQALSPAQRRAWSYIVEYVKATGRQCFTYNDLARWWPTAGTRINIQTLDRRLREFVLMKLLVRETFRSRTGRERVRFCLPEDLASFYLERAQHGPAGPQASQGP